MMGEYLFICYPKCTTCQKAKKWLEEQGVRYHERNIKEENPTETELAEWSARSGLLFRKFFNSSGLLYKSLRLKERLAGMSEPEQLALLGSNGMLVKRPILIGEDRVWVGFKENEWETLLSHSSGGES
jgi:arsenate reductase